MQQHVRSISMKRPAKAQFEAAIQLVAMINAIISVLGNVREYLGMEPTKGESD